MLGLTADPKVREKPTQKQIARANVRLAELPKRKQTAKALAALIEDEQSRTYVPNRAMLRRAGVHRGRRSFSQKRALVAAIARGKPLTEEQKDRRAAREIRLADRRQRLLLDVPLAPRPPKLNKYGRVEKG